MLGISASAVSTNDERSVKQNTGKEIIYRTLGRTGIRLPIVNMGVMNAFNPALVKRSYEIGIRHFDTAAAYARGRSEEMLGSIVKGVGARDQIIIGTKV